MVSCNGFLLAFLDFSPHPLQLTLSALITMPGVFAILWPTYNLYRLLITNKENRTTELLDAGRTTSFGLGVLRLWGTVSL